MRLCAIGRGFCGLHLASGLIQYADANTRQPTR